MAIAIHAPPLPSNLTVREPSVKQKRSQPTTAQWNVLEAESILKTTVKYLAEVPSDKVATFDFSWALQLHREKFGDGWTWAGIPRTATLTAVGAQPIHMER